MLWLAGCVLGCATGPTPAPSPDSWVVLHTGQNGDSLAINSATIVRNGAIVTFQERNTFVPPRPVFFGKEMTTIITNRSVKCDERVGASLGGHAVSVAQEIVPMPVARPTYREIPDEARTPAAMTFHYVCGLP